MGYTLSRFEDAANMDDEVLDAHCTTQKLSDESSAFTDEFYHQTKLRSAPNEMTRKLSRIEPGKHIPTVKMLSTREFNLSGKGRFYSQDRCHLLSRFLPVNGPWHVDSLNSRAYVSQYSADGTLFVGGFQASQIRIYDVDNSWKVRKDILAKSLRWTVTDTSLSPDQRYLVYASLNPIVHIVDVGSSTVESHSNINEIHEGLDFSLDGYKDYFGIFSLKFSTDGRELIAGTNDNTICVYDLQANKLTLSISAHACDVNTVSFADETGHVIYSGSDDHLCKVWDRRCFSATGRAAGVLMGHLEGITFLDSRGDGRYFISNGKDQSIKLWDIRKMASNDQCSSKSRIYGWDDRMMDYPSRARKMKHPSDQSLATYTGHSVLRTLIRCYFYPAHSTGQKFIYTGSYDSAVYIFDIISGKQIGKIEHHNATVRDCSWHPFHPTLITSSWDGTIARWEFADHDSDRVLAPKRDMMHSLACQISAYEVHDGHQLPAADLG